MVRKDHLLGLKENVIIGKIIPAGTGMARYRNIEPLAINEESSLADSQEEEQVDVLVETVETSEYLTHLKEGNFPLLCV